MDQPDTMSRPRMLSFERLLVELECGLPTLTTAWSVLSENETNLNILQMTYRTSESLLSFWWTFENWFPFYAIVLVRKMAWLFGPSLAPLQVLSRRKVTDTNIVATSGRSAREGSSFLLRIRVRRPWTLKDEWEHHLSHGQNWLFRSLSGFALSMHHGPLWRRTRVKMLK